MTNFEPIKKKIWDSVKEDKKDVFNNECQALMKKAIDDWWRLGWQISPKNIDEVLDIFSTLCKCANESWKKAIECGDAPNEDISPAEGFETIFKLIKDVIKDRDSWKSAYYSEVSESSGCIGSPGSMDNKDIDDYFKNKSYILYNKDFTLNSF